MDNKVFESLSVLGLNNFSYISKEIVINSADNNIKKYIDDNNEISRFSIKKIRDAQEFLCSHIGYANMVIELQKEVDFTDTIIISNNSYKDFFDNEKLKRELEQKREKEEEARRYQENLLEKRTIILDSYIDKYSKYDKSLYYENQQQELSQYYDIYHKKIEECKKIIELDKIFNEAIDKFNSVKTILQLKKQKIIYICTAIISSVILMLLISLLILNINVFQPAKKYNEAMIDFSSGKYRNAMTDFSETSWDNSSDMYHISKAGYYFDAGVSDDGILSMVDGKSKSIVHFKNCDNIQNMIIETKDYSLPEVSKPGFDFVRWEFSEWEFKVNGDEIIAHLTYTAIWSINIYTISYELNGGAATNPVSYSIESNDIILSDPIKYGYTFTGWTNDDITTPIKNIVIPTGSQGDKIFIANWIPNVFHINYNLNGGIANNPTEFTIETNSFSLLEPSRDGYEFIGWTSKDMTTPTKKVTIVKGNSVDLFFEANWKVIEYKVTYNLNNGEAINPTKYNVESDDILLNNPTKTGYTFIGWTNDDITTPIKNIVIPKGSQGDKKFIANWEANVYKITYDVNGGNQIIDNQNVHFDSEFTLIQPERIGYTFGGWYYNNLLVDFNIWNIPNDCIFIANWTPNSNTKYQVKHYKEIDDEQFSLVKTQVLSGTTDTIVTPETINYTGYVEPTKQSLSIKADGSLIIEYYYYWIKYDVKFVTNGGNEIDDLLVKFNHYIDSSIVAIRNNYTFDRWYTDANLTSEYKYNEVNENQILYAGWKEESKPLNFDYSIVDGNCIIHYYRPIVTSDVCWIPEFIGGNKVISLDNAELFKNNGLNTGSNIKKLVIPNCITYLLPGTLYWCQSLESLSIPFVGDSSHSPDDDNQYPFTYMFGLKQYDTSYTQQQYYGVDKDTEIYQGRIPLSLKEVIITNSSLICYGAFANCKSIERIVLCDPVTLIGDIAFANCDSLSEVIFSKNISSIGNSAFSECYSLESFVTPDHLLNIGDYCFNRCENLKTVAISDNVHVIGNGAFNYCFDIYEIIIGKNVTMIADDAFHFTHFKVINYNSTISSWNDIVKGDDWSSTSLEKIICTDGEINIK